MASTREEALMTLAELYDVAYAIGWEYASHPSNDLDYLDSYLSCEVWSWLQPKLNVPDINAARRALMERTEVGAQAYRKYNGHRS